jgi:hypothetical protein
VASAALTGGDAPLLPPQIRQFYAPKTAAGSVYRPHVAGAADVSLSSSRYGVEERRQRLYALEVGSGPMAVDWQTAEALSLTLDDVADEPAPGATFAECPPAASNAAHYTLWEKQFRQWLRRNECIRLLKSERFRLTSAPAESEGEFRARLQQTAAEQRDQAIAKLRKRFATKATTLENRLLRARQAIGREAGQSSSHMVSTAVSFGTAILGAVLGRKRLSAATASRVGSAIRSASSVRKQASEVVMARQTEAKVAAEIEQLNADLEAEVAALDISFDAQSEELTEIFVRPKAADVHVPLFGLLWMP